MKYYQVKYGYKDNESVSISEEEMPSAVRAQITGRVGVFKEGTVSGNSIIAIVPDYTRTMGWNRGYNLLPEDWAKIDTSKECKEARLLLEETVLKLKNGDEPKQLH